MLKRFPPLNTPRQQSREQPPMRTDTRQRKHAMVGLRAISGEQQLLGVLTPVRRQEADARGGDVGGRMVAKRVMLIEREEIAGPD